MNESRKRTPKFQFGIVTLIIFVALAAGWLGTIRLGGAEIASRYVVLLVLVAAAGRLAHPHGRSYAFWQGFVLTCAMHLFGSSGLADSRWLTEVIASRGSAWGFTTAYDYVARATWPLVVVIVSIVGGALSARACGDSAEES